MIPGITPILTPEDVRRAGFITVQLDWASYWEEFKAIHGGDPVRYKGRLLFRDGWTHSATDMAGPEWPPPDDPDQLLVLRKAYWLIKRKLVQSERDYLRQLVANLRELQSQRSATLKQWQIAGVDEDGKQVIHRSDASADDLEQGRLKWLEDTYQDCCTQLSELTQLAENKA